MSLPRLKHSSRGAAIRVTISIRAIAGSGLARYSPAASRCCHHAWLIRPSDTIT
jgi:hypothetical protein